MFLLSIFKASFFFLILLGLISLTCSLVRVSFLDVLKYLSALTSVCNVLFQILHTIVYCQYINLCYDGREKIIARTHVSTIASRKFEIVKTFFLYYIKCFPEFADKMLHSRFIKEENNVTQYLDLKFSDRIN